MEGFFRTQQLIRVVAQSWKCMENRGDAFKKTIGKVVTFHLKDVFSNDKYQ